MILLWVINIIIITCFVISLVIIYFPLSIYELVSLSSTYNVINYLHTSFNDNRFRQIMLFLSKNVIYKTQGNITWDINSNQNKSYR